MRLNKTTFEQELEKNGKIVYTNVGTSMMPLLRQKRDLIIIEKPHGRLKKYDVPLYKRPSGQYVLHRILKVRENDYVICGDHCYRREFGVTDSQIIGVLTGFIRDGKTYSVNNKGYKAYVHLWCDFFYVRAFILRSKAFLRRVLKGD
ncbi:MAG: S24/S26 family peptidase [Acutalibacteraceae bacterium]